MGYTAYSYMGAYIQLPKVEKEFNKTIRRCSNSQCSNHKNLNMSKDFHFCNKCGKEVEQIEQKETKSTIPDYYSFGENYGFDPEIFAQVQNNREILIPNRSFGSVASWEENEEIIKEFNLQEAEKAVAEFKEVAKDFIKKFKEVHSVDLEVKFGVISYIM